MKKIIEKDKLKGWRNDWISIYKGFRKLNFVVSPASYFDNRWYISFSLIYFQFYIHLPIRSKYDECDPPRYGFYFYSTYSWFPTMFVICKGKETKHIHFPWQWDWVRTSILRKDGQWEHSVKGNDKSFWEEKWKDIIWQETHDYTYTLKNGTVQNRTANIKVEEREWRPRWFKWTGIVSKIRKTISIDFNDEVGERTGSWKGGTLGCGWDMLPNETPLETLRRMEKERRFN